MKCHNCGKEVSQEFNICPYCGERLEKPKRRSNKCRKCGKPIKSEYKLCPFCGTPTKLVCTNCGKELEESFKRCPFCGTPVLEESPKSIQSKTTEKPIHQTQNMTISGDEQQLFSITAKKIGSSSEKLLIFTNKRIVVANIGSGIIHNLMGGSLMRIRDKSKAEEMMLVPIDKLLADRKNYQIPYNTLDQINVRERKGIKAGVIAITMTNGKIEKYANTSKISEDSIISSLSDIIPEKVFKIFN